LVPLSANAQSLTLSLSLSPLGDTTAYGGSGFTGASPGALGGYAQGPSTTEVIPPDQSTPIYVYATVTGTSPVSPSYVDGLQYVYFNILQNGGGVNTSEGTITSAIPNATLGFNGNGSQNGSTGYTSGSLAIGSTSLLTGVVKPRATRGIYSTNTSGGQLTSDGSNVIVSGNSISFLVETLEYTPAKTSSSYTANGGVTNSFSIAPESSLTSLLNASGGEYAGANYMVGLPSNPGFNTGAGASYTLTSYNVSSSSVSLIDAEPGDATLGGTVDSTDFVVELSNFEKGITGWTNGDFDGQSSVDSTDLVDTLSNFEKPYAVPSGVIAGPTALISGSPVPEPTSLGLISLAGAATLVRRRRVVK
jgi:hypothetical protein